MMFLDAIASPFDFFEAEGLAVVFIAICCLIGLTMVVFALRQRFSKKKKQEDEE